MEDENQDHSVDNHIQQVRLARKTGRQVDRVSFLEYLDDYAKEQV